MPVIGFVSHHYARPGMEKALKKRLDETGVVMSKYPGFVARYNVEAVDDPTHITAVAFWESEEAEAGWNKGPDRGRGGNPPLEAMLDPSRPVFRMRFHVVGEYRPAPGR